MLSRQSVPGRIRVPPFFSTQFARASRAERRPGGQSLKEIVTRTKLPTLLLGNRQQESAARHDQKDCRLKIKVLLHRQDRDQLKLASITVVRRVENPFKEKQQEVPAHSRDRSEK